jgi:ribosomal protein L37AE/L43A
MLRVFPLRRRINPNTICLRCFLNRSARHTVHIWIFFSCERCREHFMTHQRHPLPSKSQIILFGCFRDSNIQLLGEFIVRY